ncbi:MAG: hypothetical protein A2826_03080 [Candidatus Doudnabacteria bacterium RIFCSPHIGHO2_01_FULL_43_23]|uniref:DNA 3'-5' helicase n=1 Tax=Candidatus Doudnabacteria bacterium RIFCSPHIGHO2_01_FULL_43_23 TaxID=1817822 RepID=A0A1F5NRC9_9BACT|nr:MAG: hypothetical protein A2826_03080 [Candidatus Doudnabacteria bacterium RIFCSPHIGHO2_01_FULL_43_23]
MSSKESKLLNGLNKEQIDAVTHKDGPLLIVAGAGTGKTTVITRRIAWLIEQGFAKPDEILALTFTEKAALEMEERVDKLLPYGYTNLWVSTFHAFCQRILDSHSIAIGLPVNFKLLSETEQWVLIRKNLERFDLDYFRPIGNPSRFIKILLKHFSRAKDELISPSEYVEYAKNLSLDTDSDLGISSSPKKPSHKVRRQKDQDGGEIDAMEVKKVQEVANAFAVYQNLLIENNALDFGDLINYTYELFRKRPNIAAHYRKQFKYILVDEFQDTNYAQYELVRWLLGSPSPDSSNITVVGDDDQSIYKFRGASVSNILKFKEDFKSAKQIALIQNYRSRQNLLDMAHEFVKLNNPERLEEKLKISKKLKSNFKDPGEIKVLKYPDYFQEAEGVMEKILAIKKADKESAWDDFAILVRSNDSAEIFIDTLDRAGLPYIHLSRSGLYKKLIVQQVLAYLKLLDNYHESRSVYRVLNLPIFGFSDEDLAQIVSYGNRKAYSLYDAIKQIPLQNNLSETGRKSVNLLLTLVQKHTALARAKPVNEVFVHIVRDLKIAHEESERGPETTLEVQNLSYLNQFHRKIQDFIAGSDQKLLKDFMEEIDLELASGETGTLDFDTDLGPETIKIITVHSAKGLEFKYVFVVALVEKKFPSISRSEPIELPDKLVKDILPTGDFHIQEERRLFYVAMTRAKVGLYLTYALDYNGSTVRKPSVFLKDLGLASNELPGPTGKVEFKEEKKVISKPKYPPLRWYSYSKIASFDRCSLEFFNRYVLKVPEPGAGIVSYGQTIHKVLENYLKLYKQQQEDIQGDLFSPSKNSKKISLPSISKLKEFYKQAWVDDWYEDSKQKQAYWEQGEMILVELFEYFKENSPRPKYIEDEFKLDIGGRLFKGRLDRADVTQDGIIIIDYKTVPKKKTLDKRQLVVYQIASQEFFKEKVADLQYWFLTDKLDIAHFKADEKQILETKDFLGTMMGQIEDAFKTGDFAKYHKKHQNCKFE